MLGRQVEEERKNAAYTLASHPGSWPPVCVRVGVYLCFWGSAECKLEHMESELTRSDSRSLWSNDQTTKCIRVTSTSTSDSRIADAERQTLSETMSFDGSTEPVEIEQVRPLLSVCSSRSDSGTANIHSLPTFWVPVIYIRMSFSVSA